ncbi:type II toxin-antitoxin system VapC family toxin [Synechococcus sp. CS-1325]|uniref:type II toxin-antitoxin system VapC family toxin n=1 Tax=unclassified Synechococcus TaxID=2626047 RepID=UPI000DB82641|nr:MULTISPECIES: type II toxin-antitoxin system VapC family toxin [unclassified Synechococcus]MCT0200493.1 type II toxin-antitoxin system VapC family toxin [Synechococcus sp. CS-1325]MCT0213463.1 type II toxin-antitoxin system VapC family toxin [Synechococcus sp. CS-1326]MCT0232683.1 type II toxin-antitoxin system VapC family toxin [Synechococcus sp. CS-1327]PZV00841.1 MAG: PIN domain nuclease [Cyanobium sp.]
MTVVLDASALLAYLREEPGAEVVDGVLAQSVMASVNWAEVVQKSISAGVDVEGMLEEFQALGVRVEPFLPVDGDKAGRLWASTRQVGLSLGDRACLSLGLRLGLTVVTCDRAWAGLPLDVVIQVV